MLDCSSHCPASISVLNRAPDARSAPTLTIDAGDLMRRVVARNAKLRLVAFNVSNYFSNDVTGKASGGVPFMVATAGASASVYDLRTGVLLGFGNLMNQT